LWAGTSTKPFVSSEVEKPGTTAGFPTSLETNGEGARQGLTASGRAERSIGGRAKCDTIDQSPAINASFFARDALGFQRFDPARKILAPHKRHRHSPRGEIAMPAGLVLADSAIEVIGMAGVISTVGAS
jgi:hypothetical protein